MHNVHQDFLKPILPQNSFNSVAFSILQHIFCVQFGYTEHNIDLI